MVKSISDENGIKMPSFFGYMLCSLKFLIPVFIIDTLVFFFIGGRRLWTTKNNAESWRTESMNWMKKCIRLPVPVWEKHLLGEKARVLDNLTVLIVSNPQGHLLRSELALIGNMARSIRDKDARHDLLIEYNDILEEIANLPMSFWIG